MKAYKAGKRYFKTSCIPIISVFLNIIFFSECTPTEPGLNPKLSLSVEDYSCTEVWLRLTAEDIDGEIALKQDGITIQNIILSKADTILYIDSLLPNTSYTYSVTSTQNQVSSNKVTATTLDTTSHSFSWQTYTFGDYSSVLRDVAIVGEDNIWAVGEIYFNDSTGQLDPTAYNIVIFGNQKSTVKRLLSDAQILYPGSIGDDSIFAGGNAVFSFNEHIWISAGNVHYYNGENWIQMNGLYSGFSNKLWGTSNQNLFFCGGNGFLSNYNGSSWQKLESGTETSLLDVFGEGDNVFIGGWVDFKESVLLRYNNGKLKTIINELPTGYSPDRISGGIKSVWVKRKHLFTLTWEDLYRSSVETNGEGESYWGGDATEWGANRVRGTDVNNIFTAGYNGYLWHYNGVSWKLYDELVNPTDRIISLAVTDNLIVAVGYRYLNGIENYGLLIIGRR